MEVLIKKINQLKQAAQPSNFIVEVMRNDKLKQLIINLNAGKPGSTLPTSQLFALGVNSKGIRLENIGGGHPATGIYAPNTIEGVKGQYKGKKELGLPYDRITLYSSGEFYESFKVSVLTKGRDAEIIITADPTKEGTNLYQDWGEDIIGLTEENKEIFISEFKSYLINFIKSEISKNI